MKKFLNKSTSTWFALENYSVLVRTQGERLMRWQVREVPQTELEEEVRGTFCVLCFLIQPLKYESK